LKYLIPSGGSSGTLLRKESKLLCLIIKLNGIVVEMDEINSSSSSSIGTE
jgi:hypothetical protein